MRERRHEDDDVDDEEQQRKSRKHVVVGGDEQPAAAAPTLLTASDGPSLPIDAMITNCPDESDLARPVRKRVRPDEVDGECGRMDYDPDGVGWSLGYSRWGRTEPPPRASDAPT